MCWHHKGVVYFLFLFLYRFIRVLMVSQSYPMAL